MGASADEIDREITSTRQHLDRNLDVLERRAVSGARRVATLAALGLAAGLVAGGAAFLIYRRMRRPTLGERIQDMLPAGLAGLPDEIREKLKHRPVKVVVSDASETREPGTWEVIARKAAPAILSSAASALLAQAMRRRGGQAEE